MLRPRKTMQRTRHQQKRLRPETVTRRPRPVIPHLRTRTHRQRPVTQSRPIKSRSYQTPQLNDMIKVLTSQCSHPQRPHRQYKTNINQPESHISIQSCGTNEWHISAYENCNKPACAQKGWNTLATPTHYSTAKPATWAK